MRSRRSLSLLGLILLGLLHTSAAPALPGWLRFALSFVILVWYPGWLLLSRLGGPRERPPAFSAPFALLTGVSAHAILCALLAVVGAGYTFYARVAITVVAIGLVADAVRPGRLPHWRSARGATLTFVLLAVVAWAQAGGIGFNEDAYDHIGYVGRILQDGKLFPAGVLAPPAGGGSVDVPDPRKGTLHPLIALVCQSADVTPLQAWRWLPMVTFPLAFMAFLQFCGAFVRGRAALAWCGAMFLATWSGVGLLFADETVYGQNLAVQWLWLLVPLALDGGGSGAANRRVALPAALGGAFVHAGVPLHLGLLAGTLFAFPGLLGLPRRDAVKWAAVLLLGMLPGTLLRLAWTSEPNLLHGHIQGVLFLTGKWFVASPVDILRQHGLLFAGGLVLLPVAAVLARHNALARRQVAFAILPTLICFLPWLATPLFHRITYMVFRSVLNIPVFPVVVVVVVGLVSWARSGGVLRRVPAAALLIVWSVVFVTPGLRSVFAEVGRAGEHRSSFVAEHADLVRFLRTLPANSVIASDPMTSYALSAVTPHRFVAVYGQHGTPYDPLAMERLRAVRNILSPWAVTSDVLRACDRFGVDFVVVNGASRIRCGDYLTMWDAGFAPAVVPRLESMSGRFRRLHGDDPAGITVLLHDPAGRGDSFRGAPRSPLRGAVDGPACRVDAPDDAFAITRAGVEPSTAVAGDSILVSLEYRRDDMVAPGLPIVIHLRFDSATLPPERRYPGEKQMRRLRERFTGRFLRFRHDRSPAGGCYPVDFWPIGREVSETFPVYVPRTMALGRYRVEVSVQRVPMLPNFTLGDFLYNRDHYSGRACLELELSDRAVKAR